MPKKPSKASQKHAHKGPHRAHTSPTAGHKVTESRNDKLVNHDTQQKRWQDKIIEPENYDWAKEEEKDWEERE